MEMEVALVPAPPPQTAADFNFESTCSSPYITAPSSPQRFGNFFFSAPSSPTRSKKNCPKNHPEGSSSNHGDDHDFEFNFSGQLERPSLSAEELFDGGKIRPLKQPLRSTVCIDTSSPRSPKSPSTAAVKRDEAANHRPRGREKINSSSSIRKGSRSLSPLRVSDIIFTTEDDDSAQKDPKLSTSSSSSSTISSVFSSSSFLKVYRKWKLKDFLLFRSASEGHATSKDPLMKYAVLKPAAEDVKNSSFRSSESGGSALTVSLRRRRAAPVSAHELHYTANRAVSEEMRRKTFLPYRRGLLGCLGFNPGVHEISRGIGSLTRG